MTSAWPFTTTGRATRSSPRPTWPTKRSRPSTAAWGCASTSATRSASAAIRIAAAEQFADRLFDIHMKDIDAGDGKGSSDRDRPRHHRHPPVPPHPRQVGYAGIVSFEHEKDSADPLPGLAESVGYVKGVLAVI